MTLNNSRILAGSALAFTMMFVILSLAPTHSGATAGASDGQTAPDGPTLSRYDLTGDGVPDIVQGYPHGNLADPGNVPGEVHIVSGATGDTLRIIRGTEIGDQFGYAIAYGGDLSLNGYVDLVIGAPQANAVAVVSTVIVAPDSCAPSDLPFVVDVLDVAEFYWDSPAEYIFDAGYDVGAFYDFREDDLPALRFAARYINDDNEIATREYIVHGYTGLILGRVERYIQHDGLARPRGDATRDGRVHERDMEIVVENYGEEGSDLTADDGDFTGNQQIGEDDLMIVIQEQGRRLYDPTTEAPPPDFTPQSEGCDSYYARGDNDQWYHVELFGLGCTGPMGATAPSPYDCKAELLAQCADNERVQEALQLIEERCGGAAGELDYLDVFCIECQNPPDDFKPKIPRRAHILPNPWKGKMTIVICLDSPFPAHHPICHTLAHELTHASQYCFLGLQPDMTHDNICYFLKWFNQRCNAFCREWEAHNVAGTCDSFPDDPEACCKWVCNAHKERLCIDDCDALCSKVVSDDCCFMGLWTCSGADCSPFSPTWDDCYKKHCEAGDGSNGGVHHECIVL